VTSGVRRNSRPRSSLQHVDGSLSKLDSAKRNYCSDENQV